MRSDMISRPLLLMAVIIFAFSTFTCGQSVQFKLNLSPRITWYQTNIGEQITTHGGYLGYQAGVGMYLFFAPHYAFTTGIQVLSVGGNMTYADTVILQLKETTVPLPSDEVLNTRIQFAGIPVGLHFETVEIGYLRFFTDLGMNVLYRVNSTGSTEDYTIEKGFLNKEIRSMNLAYYGTAGFSYSLGETTALQFGLSYTHGLLDLTTDENDKPHDRLIFHSLGVFTSIIF